MIDGQTRPMLAMEYSTSISNAHQLQLMGMDLGANYRLIADIDMTGSTAQSGIWGSAGFAPIGNDTSRFTGSFDGQNHIKEYTEKSLKNLGVDCIDLLQFHVWEDAWANDPRWQRAIADLKAQGLMDERAITTK